MKRGTLFVVATPIGNLEDMTLRALRVLGQVTCVAAEDTRTARFLLDHHNIGRPALVSYFEGNETARAAELLGRLEAGEDIALISEAGTPGVSDPGYRLVAAAAEAGIRVEAVPGACAAVAALASSGLPSDRWMFVGFLPRTQEKRREAIAQLQGLQASLVLYEAPTRVGATLADLALVLGEERRAVLGRELTKMHEELVRGTLAELAARYAETPPRGEVTLVVEGASPEQAGQAIDLPEAVKQALAEGRSPKEIAAELALASGKPRRAIYQLALALRGRFSHSSHSDPASTDEGDKSGGR